MGIRINTEELLLFKYLLESKNGSLTREQIKKYIYSDHTKASVTARLNKLRKEEFIRVVSDPLGRGTVVMATEKSKNILQIAKDEVQELTRGKSQLEFYEAEFYKVKDQLDFRQYNHDVLLNELRFILEDAGVNFWIPEPMIQSRYNYPTNPDGIFNVGNAFLSVELENTYKSLSRYKDIFKRHLESELDYIRNCLYITTSDTLYNSLQEMIKPKNIKYTSMGYEKFFVGKMSDIQNKNFVFKRKYDNKKLDLNKYLG